MGTYKNQDLKEQVLSGATINNCDLVACTLQNCNVHKADMVGCRVSGGTLRSVDLKGMTVVEQATINETDLYDCTLTNTTVHTFDVKGTVNLNGGRMQMGEVKPGGRIINNGGVVAGDVDNYVPVAPQVPAGGYPVAQPVGGGYPPPVAPPVGGGAYHPGPACSLPRNATVDDSGAPNRFLCPITMEVMTDPVMSRNGHNFERAAITDWLKTNSHCPQTRDPMSAGDLSPNRALKEEIEEWVAKQKS